MTISCGEQPQTEIRLSERGGKADAGELARIRQAIADLPAVEVFRLEDPPKRSRLISQATLVGWLSDKEILVIKDGTLVAFDVAAGVERKSQIKVQKESQVFIR